MEMLLPLPDILMICLISTLGLYCIYNSRTRSTKDVAIDLDEFDRAFDDTSSQDKKQKEISRKFCLQDEFSACGLFEAEERRRYKLQKQITPLVVALFFLTARLVLEAESLPGLLAACVLGLSLGYMYTQHSHRKKKEEYIQDITFYLPVVMERLVMAVQAGLDIVAAIKTILDLEFESSAEPFSSQANNSRDPVTRLLEIVYRLTEAGLSFEDALHDVSMAVNSSAFKHALIHLTIAQQEGGELIIPLRELSDSTQLYYQESIEEEIAKLPVKATLPLLCTFAGLITCFISSPLVQVLTITAQAMPE